MPKLTRAAFDALPEYAISGTVRAVTDPVTGVTRADREPARFLVQNDAGLVRDAHGALWMVFTDQDGTLWKQRTGW